jgi:hypothetical protein
MLIPHIVRMINALDDGDDVVPPTCTTLAREIGQN